MIIYKPIYDHKQLYMITRKKKIYLVSFTIIVNDYYIVNEYSNRKNITMVTIL